MRDAGGGWREATVEGVGAGARYFYLLDGERRRPDPASRAQPDGVHGPSEVVDPRRFAWRHAAAAAAACASSSSTSCTSAPSRARARSTPPPRSSAGSSISASPPSRSCRSPASPGARNWGYDGVGWFAPQAIATAAPTACARSSTPATATASPSSSTSSTTTSAPRETTSASSGPTSRRAITRRGATPSITTGDAGGAPIRARQRAHVVRRLSASTGCASTRCTPSPTPRRATSSPTWRRWRAARQRLIIAESDLGDVNVIAPSAGGLGLRRAVVGRFPPRAARRRHRRAARLLRRLRHRRAAGDGDARRLRLPGAALAASRAAVRHTRRASCPASASSSARRTTIKSAIAPSVSGSRSWCPAASTRWRRRCCSRPRCRCCSWARSTAIRRRSNISPIIRTPGWRRRCATAGGASSRVQRRGGARSAGARDARPLGHRSRARRRRASRRAAPLVSRADARCGASIRSCARQDARASPSSTRRRGGARAAARRAHRRRRVAARARAAPQLPKSGWRIALDAGDFGGATGAAVDRNIVTLPAWGAVILLA